MRCHTDQLKKVDNTSAENPSQQLQESQDNTMDWTIIKEQHQVDQSTRTASQNHFHTLFITLLLCNRIYLV